LPTTASIQPQLKSSLMGISKRGNQHLPSLLVHGARAVVRTAPRKTDLNNQWVNQLRERRGFNRQHNRSSSMSLDWSAASFRVRPSLFALCAMAEALS
jgi:hypothetical protein